MKSTELIIHIFMAMVLVICLYFFIKYLDNALLISIKGLIKIGIIKLSNTKLIWRFW